MGTTFVWIAADRHGRLAKMSAEHGGVFPKDVVFLDDDAESAVLRALHDAWIEHVAPQIVAEHNDLAYGRSRDPMLVMFEREPPSGDGVRVGPTAVRYGVVPHEIRAHVEAALARENAGRVDPPDTPKIVGAVALDRLTFLESEHDALFSYARWGGPEAYRRTVVPRFPLLLTMLRGAAENVVTLDVDFATTVSVDLRTVLPEQQQFVDLARPRPVRR